MYAVTAEGRIVMLVEIGITSTFISTLAVRLTRSRIKEASTENDPKLILKIRVAKGKITKESYPELLKLLSELCYLIDIKYRTYPSSGLRNIALKKAGLITLYYNLSAVQPGI
jgi:hypothetical protein